MPKIEKDDIERCVECHAYKGHNPTCSLIDLETAKEELKRYYKAWLNIKEAKNEEIKRAWDITSKYRSEISKWEGKFLIVKNENNKLRKKLIKQSK